MISYKLWKRASTCRLVVKLLLWYYCWFWIPWQKESECTDFSKYKPVKHSLVYLNNHKNNLETKCYHSIKGRNNDFSILHHKSWLFNPKLSFLCEKFESIWQNSFITSIVSLTILFRCFNLNSDIFISNSKESIDVLHKH